MQTEQKSNPEHASDTIAVKRWLAELPTLDPKGNVIRIHESLQRHNAVEMAARDRLELLDCYHESVTLLMHDLQKYLVGLMLPLPQASLNTSDMLRKLLYDYAQGYLIVVDNDIANAKVIEAGPDREVLVKACHAAIRNISQILRGSYESYRETPSGVWKQLHEVFRRALFYEIEAEEFIDKSGETVSICNEYKRSLLMGLCGPYELPFRAVNFVFDRLQQWAPDAQLSGKINKDSGSNCLFIVDASCDRPAVPCLSLNKVQNAEQDLILDTSALIDSLNCQIKTMIGNTVTDVSAEVTDFEHIATLKALITRWGAHPMRRTHRSVSYAQYSAIVGLGNISKELTDGNEAAAPSVRLREPDDMLRGTFGQQQHLGARSRTLADPWRAIDESLNGIRCRVKSSEGTQAQVGELVSLRPVSSKQASSIGIIRWAKENLDNTVDLGIYKLGTKVFPVRIRLAAEEDQNTLHNDYGGLFLPADPSIKREQTLIVPNGLYWPKRLLWIRSNNAGSDYIVEVANLILAGRPFDWFEIRSNRAYGLNRGGEYSMEKRAESSYCPPDFSD